MPSVVQLLTSIDLRHPTAIQNTTSAQIPQEWRCLFDTLPKEWMESVQLVLDYFCERTPRSFVEVRDTSLVWNYKHADVEFGRLQARDLLQVRL
jgi:trehalose 6-phosphate synthase/phosphatase